VATGAAASLATTSESGVVVATFWESAEARDDYQSQPEHGEALRSSGLLDAVTEMRSRVFEDADLKLPWRLAPMPDDRSYPHAGAEQTNALATWSAA